MRKTDDDGRLKRREVANREKKETVAPQHEKSSRELSSSKLDLDFLGATFTLGHRLWPMGFFQYYIIHVDVTILYVKKNKN